MKLLNSPAADQNHVEQSGSCPEFGSEPLFDSEQISEGSAKSVITLVLYKISLREVSACPPGVTQEENPDNATQKRVKKRCT